MISPKQKMIYREKGRDPLFKTWHATDAITILFVQGGEGSIVCAERSYPLGAGTICLIGRGKYHYTLPEHPEAYVRSKIFIPFSLFEKILALFPNEKIHRMKEKTFVYSPLSAKAKQEAERIFQSLLSSDAADREASFVAASLQLLILLDRFSSADILAAQNPIAQAVEYINRNLSKELSMDEICEALHISKYHFCRKFKQSTGMTVMNYILKTRITLARDMLSSTQNSITEISMKCGFSSVSYFCRVFKTDVGKTPSDFRKSAKNP